MVEIPREMAGDPEARAAWEAASPEEQLRTVTSVADLVEQDRADPTTPDHFDIELVPLEGVEPDEEDGARPAKVGSASNVTKMRAVAAKLKSWGWTVVESPGWETRGVSILTAGTIGCHHTAAEVDIDRILRDGRSDLNGPLCNFALHLDGTVVLMAAGTANHFGVASVSNNRAWGIEATGPVPISAQGPKAFPNYTAYTALCTAIRLVEGWSVNTIKGHKEVALPDGRKIDPAFGDPYPKPYPDMDRFRAACNVTRVLKTGSVEDTLNLDKESQQFILRALLAAQSGKANSAVTAAEAAWFQPSSNSQVYELLAYGDARDDTKDPNGHPNNTQRVRLEMAQDRATIAANFAAMTKMIEALVAAGGAAVDLPALKTTMIEAAEEGAATALSRIDVVIAPDLSPTPAHLTPEV
jgi:hypothetical protein